MKLLVKPFNNGAGTWTESEETNFLSYSIRHRFNQPAEAVVVLPDPTGAMAQKYNVDANDVYIGAGKITIEDPTATDIFYGRIMKAEANSASRTLTLHCEDWLSQLNEEQITYDMREDLDGSGLRESTLYSDYDEADGLERAPANLYHCEYAKWYNNDDTSYTDESGVARQDTADDMTLFNAGCEVNDAYYYGFLTSSVTEFDLNLTTQGSWTGAITWEYWDGDSWESLPGISDGTSAYEAAVGWRTVSWTDPGDWAAVAVDGDTAYWVRSRVSSFVALATDPLGGQVKIDGWSYVYDKNMSWGAGDYDGMYFILSDKIAGTKSWKFWPVSSIDPGGITYTDDVEHVWIDDIAQLDIFFDNADFNLDYLFKPMLGHNTPANMYVHDSITGARITCNHKVTVVPDTNHVHIEILENDGATYIELDHIEEKDTFVRDVHRVPDEYVPYIVDSNGEVTVRFNVDWNGGNASCTVAYLELELDVTTTGYSNAALIVDTLATPDCLGVNIGFADNPAAARIWEGANYSIAQPIYKHLDSAESGVIITDGDIMETLTCAATIEHTSGISTRQYINKTRLEIIRDLAQQDKAEFWIALGGTTVTYKSTWNDGAPTAMTDTSGTLSSSFDYTKLANEWNVYGMRVGDQQLQSNVTDATSIAKYKATRSRTSRDAGLTSEYDTLARGTALVAQHKDVQQMISVSIPGLDSTYRLGTEVSLTSTYLGLTAAKYIVDSWEYDSKSDVSRIHMHPRISTTGLIRDEFASGTQGIQTVRRGSTDTFIASPDSDTV